MPYVNIIMFIIPPTHLKDINSCIYVCDEAVISHMNTPDKDVLLYLHYESSVITRSDAHRMTTTDGHI